MKCSSCGEELPEDKSFCPFCGAKTGPAQEGTFGTEPKSKKVNVRDSVIKGKVNIFDDPDESSGVNIQDSAITGGVNVSGASGDGDAGIGLGIKDSVIAGGVHIQQVVESLHCAITGVMISPKEAFRCPKCHRIVSQQCMDARTQLCTQCAETATGRNVKVFIVEGPSGKKEFSFSHRFSIGRDNANDISLNLDKESSRRHAEIWFADGKWMIKDAGSTFGTFVNGNKCESPRELREGDLIQIGQTVLGFGTAGCDERTVRGGATPSPAKGGPSGFANATTGSLKVVKGERRGLSVSFDSAKKTEYTIGRLAENDISLGDSDKSVSRKHAKIVGSPQGGFTIIDLGSSNGTFVDGVKLAKGQQAQLKVGSSIVLGDSELQFM